MPVVFVLDTSLPMSSNLRSEEKAKKKEATKQKSLTKLDVAKVLIKSLIDQIVKNDEFECFSLVTNYYLFFFHFRDQM